MSAEKTKAFSFATILTIAIILAEMATCILDVLGPQFRALNIFANVVGFSLSPCISLSLAVLFDQSLYRKLKYICIPFAVNTMFLLSSIWTGWVFYVSPDNIYSRGPLYFIFIFTYLYSLVLLMVSNCHQSSQYQSAERYLLLTLYGIILTGTTIQVVCPKIYATWHCTTLVLVVYYIFQCELRFKYDIVTNTLNRQVFESALQKLKDDDHASLILFDIDKFKEINDTYGHPRGDHYLKIIADIIKYSFKGIGQCYRVGGDEFCVITNNVNREDIHSCILTMEESIKQARKKDAATPSVSYGYDIHNINEPINSSRLFYNADKEMYDHKAVNNAFVELEGENIENDQSVTINM